MVEEPSKAERTDNRSLFRRITDVYFAPKGFEKNGTLYKALGVKQWQKIVMGTVGKTIRVNDGKPSNYYIGKDTNLEALSTFEKYTRINEAVHSPITLILGYCTIENVAQGNVGGAALNGTLFLVNLYCTLLQRYNRERVCRVKERLENRKK